MEEILSYISLALLVIRILADTYIGRIMRIDILWRFVIKLVSFVPLVGEVLGKIKEMAEKYDREKRKELILKLLPTIYLYVENTMRGVAGEDKKRVLISLLRKEVNLEGVEDFVDQALENINRAHKEKGIEGVVESVNSILRKLIDTGKKVGGFIGSLVSGILKL